MYMYVYIYIYDHIHMYIYIYIYTHIYTYKHVYLVGCLRRRVFHPPSAAEAKRAPSVPRDSSKGCAVETGCSDLYDVVHYFSIEYYPNPLHPPPTAPPSAEQSIQAFPPAIVSRGLVESSREITFSMRAGGANNAYTKIYCYYSI